MFEGDQHAIHRLISKNPHDRAGWNALSDWMEENGKPMFSKALKWLSQNGTPMPGNYTGGSPWMSGEHIPAMLYEGVKDKTNGVIAGIPIRLNRTPSGHWELVIKKHSTDKGDDQHYITHPGIVELYPEHGAHLHNEIDEFHGQVPYYQDAEDLRHKASHLSRNTSLIIKLQRGGIRLPLQLQAEKGTPKSTPESSMTHPEKKWLESTSTPSRSIHESLIQQIHDPASQPFSGVMPHVNTLTTLAHLGAPAKGEYQKTFNAIKKLFGHDPDGITAWLGLNGIFSPNTSYKDHAGAASLLTAAWLGAKKPRDEHTITRLIDAVDTFGKHYSHELASQEQEQWDVNKKTGRYSGITKGDFSTFGGTTRSNRARQAAVHLLQNVDKLREALQDPSGVAGENLSMVGGGGLLKVPNFVVSYPQPYYGTAIDTHMSRLIYHPTLDNFQDHSDILRQVRAHLSEPGELDRLEEMSLKGLPIKSELVKALMKARNVTVQTKFKGKALGTSGKNPGKMKVVEWLKRMNTRLLAKPQYYLAYKHAINEAAKKLGWTPAEVQESVWTGLLGIMAANQLGIPHNKIATYLTHDALRKGWQNHEAIFFPALVDAATRSGANKSLVRRLAKGQLDRAAEDSRPGILPRSHASAIPDIAAHLPGIGVRSAGRPILEAIKKHLEHQGLLDKRTNQYRITMQRSGEEGPLQLMAQYDRPVDFNGALDRVNASNQTPFIEGLKQALMQSGIIPDLVTSAIHDYAGQSRASILAYGKYSNPQAPSTGTAWVGLLGRQPGMVAFKGNLNGKDSIYTFSHHNADIVRNVLQNFGIVNRTIVPEGTSHTVYIYDPGNRLRSNVAQALSSMQATATEWRGDGKIVGGEMGDMGREKYRGEINKAESSKMGRSGKPVKLGRNDSPHIFELIKHDPHDDAPWLALADSFEDDGRENAAKFLRDVIPQSGRGYGNGVKWRYYGLAHASGTLTHRTNGTIHGIPIGIYHNKDNVSINFGYNSDNYHNNIPLFLPFGIPKHIGESLESEFDNPPKITKFSE